MANQDSAARQGDNTATFGLTAIGSAGGWEVAIDEAASGAQRWFAQIEGPSVYLYFEVDSPCVLGKMLAFLTEPGNSSRALNGGLILGKMGGDAVCFERDDEFPDRCFLVIQTEHRLVVRVTVGGADLEMLANALRQANDDLADEDSN